MTPAFALVLALTSPSQAPDLQVEASTSAGAPLPELADAVARALVASGARVVLRSPTSAPCAYCASISIVENPQGDCRLDISHDSHATSVTLHLGRSSPLFDRARAIAVQTRLLITWDQTPEPQAKKPAPRSASRRATHASTGHVSETVKPPLHETLPPPASSEATEAETLSQNPPHASPPAPLVSHADAKEPPTRVPAPSPPRAKLAEALPEEKPVLKARPSEAAKRSNPLPTPNGPRWPWIATITGSSAAIGAGICALVARDRYNALSDRSQSYDSAQAIKTEGERWQIASYVLSGVAVAGLTAGILGFTSTSAPAVRAAVVPVPGGGAFTLAGELP